MMSHRFAVRPRLALIPAVAAVCVAALLLTSCRYLDASSTPASAARPDSATMLWVGGVTDTSARLVAGLSRDPSSVTLELDTTPDFAQPRTVDLAASSVAKSPVETSPVETSGRNGAATDTTRMSALRGVRQADLDGLQPATRYWYRLVASGTPIPGKEGTFRTFAAGAQSFRAVLSSCAVTGSRHPVFDSMRTASPDLFLHLGDMHYSDIAVPELQRYRDAYATVHASPEQSRLFRSVPLAYMWDDHDYGPNNSSGAAVVQDVAQQAYRAFIPHYPLANASHGPVQQAFTVGRVRFLLTDLRSERSRNDRPDTAEKTMMGEAQKAWFKQQLQAASDDPVAIVWVSSVPWIANDAGEVDRWSGFSTERAEIAQYIDSLGIASRLVIASGDAHMAALDDGTHNRYGNEGGEETNGGEDTEGGIGSPVVQAAALDRIGSVKGGPYTHGPFPNRFSLRGANDGQFVRMDVTDTGGDEVCIEWTARRWAYDTEQMTTLFAWSHCMTVSPGE